jgi:PhoPQ-activated pathogenicity-related protein
MESKFAGLTDDELLEALDQHTGAPAVRLYLDSGVRRVHTSRQDANELRWAAKNECRDVRQGPGFVAAAFYDPDVGGDAYLVARE